ncbi:zinc finger protein 644a [Dicentrarchus labrax]|uniref:Zinc finger protein 644a n=1 Tax=Dicentrarchus labrax TaxID=13489 RepID=A0A8C4EDM0_DICLA|nr:zinc finger protein 644a [Dicentrarchus labrax]XP_051255711.1 zinc finger protein 644a [Dicentrarchus labrax]XP_051255712.1 zinc finger protein 644a [Dicentrarchus labrax]XP_051255713.1 zinc finger protein 644a [Dicentrarchus labrax]
MAAEMSCLTGVDEDDKDADPEINALTLLQEPVRMAQESASCTDSFSKPSLKQNSVLDVLSNTDMLSPVGLGNGPSSHQATQAHELNSISTEKEEAKSITPLKTVQEIDTAGIWGFDADSPENSLDNFSGASDLHWDPHKEFMQFLWDNHGDSPGEEPKEEVPPTNCQRRRKRKMDMVVMVDPSEDLYPDLSHKSSEELSDAEGQEDSIPVRKVRKSRKFSKSQSSPTVKVSKYPNGTVKAINLYNAPARNSHENSISHGLTPLKRRLTINSHSEERPSCFPCSKCKLIFKKEHHLHRHSKSHVDPSNISPKPFVCRECGQSFRQSRSLIEHMSIHQEKRERLTEEIKGVNDKKKEDKNAKLFCPQCPFGTNCPNTFVQHAKTHEKDKRKFRCDKCSFRTLIESDLRRHNIMQHTVITVTKQIQDDDPDIFSCNICSYRAFSKNVFKNHLLRRHQQTFEEYQAEQQIEENAHPSKEQHIPTCKTHEDAEFTSKILIKNQISSKRACSPSESNDISDLFKNSKIKRGLKSQLTESKLDKSINVLLSRQRHGKKTAEQKRESNNCSTSVHDSKTDKDGSDQLPGTLTVKVEDSVLSPNGHGIPSSAAKTDLSSSVPKLSEDQSAVKKSPSKRKMSTPYRNTSDQDSCFILPKPLPSPKKINQEEMSDYDEKDIFQFNDTDANADLFDNGIKKEKQNIIYTYSRRMSMRGALQASKRLFEKIKTEEQEQNDPEIKEECIETEVFQETLESDQIPLRESFTEDVSELESDRKNCPYCPAVFESGVGLSNHVRGHLHRVGLSYNARHVVPPEQVAFQDRRPRIRRKISAFRRLKKALQQESDSETVKSIHSCPLCGDSFDNRTGQSNHIRGHLKKLGKSFASKNKSPLLLLRELMRDKKEFQRALQILGKRRNHFQYGASPKLSSVDCFTPPPIGIPKNNSVTSVCTEARPLMPMFSLMEMESEKRQLETKLDVKNSLSGTTALIGILKKRKCQEDGRLKGSSQMSRNTLAVSSNSEHSSGSRVASSLPKSISEKGEFNRKVCVHCNATFHSGVSLSNHLRAYAKRKRTALLDGTTFDCKARRQRSRPGSKKKTLPLPQTPEEMYRLTCRFCDLVFQGPLSVQEDWIKHLQRHIMNTSVPHTGLSMVEVTSLPTTLKTDQDSSLTATHAAS